MSCAMLRALELEVTRRSAEAARFPSREAISGRPPRIYRTGPTMHFNARATPEGWLVSEALEHALAALKREFAGRG